MANIQRLPLTLAAARNMLLACLVVLGGCAHQLQEPANGQPALEQAIAWYTGEAGTVDDPKARALLESVQETGNPLAIMWLARVYSTGRMTYPADKAKAVAIAETVIAAVEQLARDGNPEAAFLLGTAWAEGLGKPVDPQEAVIWYRKAAETGHTLGAHNLGNVYASGTGVEPDAAEAARWWLVAATAGDAIPQFRLAEFLEQGRGVDRNQAQARYWYENAARRGNANAQAALERLNRLIPQ